MAVTFRQYTKEAGFSDDYHKVYHFLKRINQKKVTTPNFLWGRWEWMFSLPMLSVEDLDKIRIWEDNGVIVGLVTYESSCDEAFFCMDEAYDYLKEEMVSYVAETFIEEHGIWIPDGEEQFQNVAKRYGYVPVQERQHVAKLDVNTDLSYELESGFSILSLEDRFDIKEYNKVMWYGFNHEGKAPEDAEMMESRKLQLAGPNVKLRHKIAVVSPEGEFVSYCGMWHDEYTKYALVEPVATHPKFRKRGFGKAAVLEGILRCKKDGAQEIYVGSAQQFYYNIGFCPISTETMWRRK